MFHARYALRSLRSFVLPITVVCLSLPAFAQEDNVAEPVNKREFDIRKSLVRILTTSQPPNFQTPWNPSGIQRGVGAGFVVETAHGLRIMTNAHVISHATFVAIDREGDPNRYVAEVEFAGHDSDLAVIKPVDAAFLENAVPLPFGGIPLIESTVQAYGYPVGGERYSVTRGVVSRIDFQPYSHSEVDAHLAIQIDAAINPGNSGGPVMQEGLVVGVAFQGFRGDVAQNVGYMIPTPVVQRFLADIATGKYDGYPDLAIRTFALRNPAMRAALGLEQDGKGVMISKVMATGSADGFLQVGDVLLEIEGLPVTADGLIELEGMLVQLEEVVERRQVGDVVQAKVLRESESVQVEFPLKSIWPAQIMANPNEGRPSFLLYGGLLFQPLDNGLMRSYRLEGLRERYFYERFLDDEIYVERSQVVVLSAVLADPVNNFLSTLAPGVVDSVNGQTITSMAGLAEALERAEEFCVIELVGEGRPLVLETAAVQEARPRILQNYGVTEESYIAPWPPQ
ncbi:MAG: PDZ domain-containing protein [Verrucomicrobiales bacterium]